jgi:hypothetical protein
MVLEGGRGKKRAIEGVNLIKVHYVPIWKYSNEIHLYRIYSQIKTSILMNFVYIIKKQIEVIDFF